MTQHEPFARPLDIELGNIRIEVEAGNTDTVWIWICDELGNSIEGGAFDYAEFWGMVRAYYEMRV
jgi:hypothetical protein